MSDRTLSARDECPSWWAPDHTTQIHPADELHWGDLGSVATIELQTGGDGFWSVVRGLQIDVGVERAIGADTVYVSLVVDEVRDRSLLITSDSACRLSRVLGQASAAASE